MAELPLPVVFERGGQVRANSRDVAATFAKRHGDVLRAVRDLVDQAPELNQRNFASVEYVDAKGEQRAAYEMNRDGFTLLAMGFTGATALKFKLAYIDRFNAMEEELRASTAAALPRSFAEALQLAADQARRIEAQGQALAIAEPKAEALDRLEASEGSLCLYDAAKALGQPPKKFVAYLHAQGWIFQRQGSGQWAGHASHTRAGLMEHRPYVRKDRDGNDRNGLQAMITPKGLARLARNLGPKQGDLLQ